MPMIDDIRDHRGATPFQPFALRMADGREYPVPTVDHIWLPPGGRSVLVANDRGGTVSLPVQFVTGFVQDTPASESDAAPSS